MVFHGPLKRKGGLITDLPDEKYCRNQTVCWVALLNWSSQKMGQYRVWVGLGALENLPHLPLQSPLATFRKASEWWNGCLAHVPLQSPHLGHLGQRLCSPRQRPASEFYQIQKGNYRTLIPRETLADICHFAAITN